MSNFAVKLHKDPTGFFCYPNSKTDEVVFIGRKNGMGFLCGRTGVLKIHSGSDHHFINL